jgi:small GTP-binding protein
MCRLKVVISGNASVGKTSIITRFIHNNFSEYTSQTIGAAFCAHKIDNHILDIWDTAGQERYANISRIYYRGAHIFLLVFDLSNLPTIIKMTSLLQETFYNQPRAKYILIANKLDLIPPSTLNDLKTTITKRFSEHTIYTNLTEIEQQIIYFSAKTGYGLNQLRERFKLYGNDIEPTNTITKETVDITTNNQYCQC